MKVKYNEPLGVPQGSVRAIIAIVVILNALILEVLSLIKGVPRSDFSISLAGVAFGYYFGARQTESEQAPRERSEAVVMPEPADIIPGDDEDDVDSSVVVPGSGG